MYDAWVVQGDSLTLPLASGSIQGIVTSPPYGIKKSYPNDQPTSYGAHVAFLQHAFEEHRRVCSGPICWVLPLMLRGHFLYADIGEWAFATPVIAGSEKLLTQFGRKWMRAYVGVELLVCTEKPATSGGVYLVFAPQPFIGRTQP